MVCNLSLAFACGVERARTPPPNPPEKVPVENDRIRGLQYESKTPMLLQSAQNEVAA